MRRLSLLAFCFSGLAMAAAQSTAPVSTTQTEPPRGFTQAINLWPGPAPLATGTTPGDVPKLFTYPASGTGPHAAVIVMPGGGYNHLVMEKEGAAEARYLNQRGVTAFVLEYRLAPAYRFPAPMLDGARAIRYVRANAASLGVDPARIGVWGFSAGGHLAGYLATIHDAGNAQAVDPIERVSDRPDFAILTYAPLSLDPSIPRNGNMESLLGENPSQEAMDRVDVVKHVTKDTSPSFLSSTGGDQSVDALNASSYYEAMRRAGVAGELHIFELGPHGTGLAQNLAPELHELSVYPMLLANWMRQNHWMKAQPQPIDFP